MKISKCSLILASLLVVTACTTDSNSPTDSIITKASSVTTCSGGSTPILNPAQYFPLVPNSRWVYKGTATQSAIIFPYINEVNITGLQTIDGVQTTTFTESNYVGTSAETSYVSVDSTNGIKEWSIVLDGTASTPIDTVMFPLSIGKQCAQSYSNVDFGPIDPYSASSPHITGSYDIIVTIAAIEPISIAAGTFTDAMRIEVSQNIIASATVDGKVIDVNLNSTTTEWSAPDIGRIKTVYSSTSSGSTGESATEELSDYYIPFEQASTCITGDAVIASMGYGAEHYLLDTYSAIMMDSYTTVNTNPPQKHTTLIENRGLFNIQGVSSKQVHEVRSSFPPVVTDTYTSTDSFGAYDWSHLAKQANLPPLSTPTPLTLVQFPLSTGAQCSQTITNVNFGDVDFDGTDDIGYIEFSSDIYSFGTKNTTLGNFPNTFEINNKVKHKTRLSLGGIETNTLNSTEWRAPQAGLIKKTTVSNKTNTSSSTTTLVSTADTQSHSFLKLPYAANDIVYDTYSNKLYASINSGAASYADNIVAIDPVTGNITSSVLAGLNPGPLALSQDGSKLYVGMIGEPKVRSLDLPSMTLNPAFSLGSDFLFGSFYAEDIAVVPNDPYSVAVAKFDMPNKNHLGITIYKSGTPLSNSTTGVSDGNIIVFGTPNQLFGLPIHTIPQGLTTYNVNTSGVSLNASHPRSGIGFEATFSGGLLYGSNGKIFNPLTQLSTQDFIFPALSNGASVVINAAANNITFLTANQGTFYGKPYSTNSFDLTTKVSVGTNKFYLFQYYDGINSFDLSASTLQDMEVNGFAFRVFEAYNSLPISEWSIIIQK